MSFTSVFNKKDFIEYISRQIEDDEVVVITGHVSLFQTSKKNQTKDITFQYPNFAFAAPEGINDVMQSKNVAVCITDRINMKKGALDVVDGFATEFKDDAPKPHSKAKRAPKKQRI